MFNIFSQNLCGFNFLLLDLAISVSEGLKKGPWMNKSSGRNTTRMGKHIFAANLFLNLIHTITCWFMPLMLPLFLDPERVYSFLNLLTIKPMQNDRFPIEEHAVTQITDLFRR